LPRSCELALSVVYASEFEDAACTMPLDLTAGTAHREIAIEIPGQLLGTSVELSTALILAEPGEAQGEPVAWRRGSILWRDAQKVRLYGDSSQFPITEVDFRDCGLDPAAPWFVEIDGDLELPAMGAIQLLLNNRFPLVSDAARILDPERPELAVVRSELFADIGRTLVEFALAQPDLENEWPEDSLGAILTSIVRSRFGESARDLRTLRERDPTAWAAKVAASFGLLREPLR
jgi:hypothetical protein